MEQSTLTTNTHEQIWVDRYDIKCLVTLLTWFQISSPQITQMMKQSVDVIGVGPHTNNLTILNHIIPLVSFSTNYIILFLENDKITLKLLFSKNEWMNEWINK
jgi:hypothetical protein